MASWWRFILESTLPAQAWKTPWAGSSRDRALHLFQGRIEPALAGVNIAQFVPGGGHAGVQRQGLNKARARRRQLALAFPQPAFLEIGEEIRRH